MKPLRFAVVLAVPLAAGAQDVAKVDAGHYKVLIDNAAVRVLQVAVPAGEKSAMHSHPDAIVVPLTSGKARYTLPDGKTQDAELVKDTAVYSPAAAHAAANVGTTKVDAILVEFKAKEPGKAALPGARPGIQSSVLAEGPHAVAVKATTAPDFAEAAGSSHEYDQVVIALVDADISLAVEGKPAVTKWKRGDVQFIGRGVKHQARNTGGKTAEMVIVSIR